MITVPEGKTIFIGNKKYKAGAVLPAGYTIKEPKQQPKPNKEKAEK